MAGPDPALRGPQPPEAAAPDAPLQAARAAAVLAIPLHRFLGLQLLDPDDPAAGVAFDVGPSAQNQVGLLHGGVVTALLDVACFLALTPQLAADEHAVTHDQAVSLLRPVPGGSRVELVGSVLRRGQRVAFLRADARVGGRLVATAQVTKTVVPADPGRAAPEGPAAG